MAFPTVQARTVWQGAASNATSHSVTMPGSISAGDLLICVFSVDGAPTCTAPPDWQKLGQASNSTTVTGAIFWKIAEGSDTLTVTTSATEQASAITYRITGGYYVAGTSANGSSTNSNPPSQAVTDGTQDYLWIVTRSGDSTVNATVAPTGYSNLTTQNAAGTGGASTAVADRTLNTGSAQDPGTFTSNSEQWVSWTLCVSPVASTVSITPSSATLSAGDYVDLTVTVTNGTSARVGALVLAASSDATKATADAITLYTRSAPSGWTESNWTDNGDNGTSPTGVTARQWIDDSASATHFIRTGVGSVSVVNGRTYRYVAEWLPDPTPAGAWARIRHNTGTVGGTNGYAEWGLTGTFVTSTGIAAYALKDLGGGWLRSWVTRAATAGGSYADSTAAYIQSASTSSSTYVGAIDNTLDIGDAWVEELYAVTDSNGEAKIRVWAVANGTTNVTATALGVTSSASAITVSTGLSGSLSKTLDAATLSSTGEISIAGTLSATLGAATSAATGAVDLVGTLSSTLAAATAAGTGALAVSGTLSSTLGDATLSAAGTLVEAGIEGELTSTLADATVSSAGALAIEGQTAATLAAATATATGAVAISGQAAATLASATLAGTGALKLSGATAATLADATSSATGALALRGSIGAALADATLTASGAITLRGEVSATLGAAVLVSEGLLALGPSGSLSSTLSDVTLSAEGLLGPGVSPPVSPPGGGGHPKHRGKDWRRDDERRQFWESLELELRALASPETSSPASPRAPASLVTARLSDLVSNLIPSPSPSRPVRWTAPVVQPVSRDRGPADEDDELFEIILTLAEEL